VSVHAQVDGIGTLEFPDGTDSSVIHATVQKIIANKGGGGTGAGKSDKAAMPTWRDQLKEGAKAYGRLAAAPIEAAGSLISSAVAAPVAGLAGMAQGAKNVVSGDSTNMSAADRVAQVQSGMTYEPRTEGGQSALKYATTPLRLLGEGAEWTGGKAAQGASALGASPEVAGGVGAAVDTALQAAPSVLLPELAGKGPLGARIAARAKPPAPRVEPTIAPQPAAPGAQPSATPPQLPSRAPGQVEFTADPNAPKAPLQTPARQTAAQRAESYVRDRVGVDWSGLSSGLKDTITAIAQDAGALDKLDPQQVARKARLDAAGIKGTRGQVERNLAQLTKEENLVKSEAGGEIRNIKADQDTQLHQLVDNLRKESGAKAETRSQVGKSVQDSGLRARLRESKSNYDKLYKAARETEPEATVSTDPMYDFVRGNPEVLNPAIQHLNWLQGWLKKAGIESETPTAPVKEGVAEPSGNVSETTRRGVKLTELDDLRKKALSIAKGGGDNAHYAGEVIKAIDKSFEEIPEAAKAWKQARDAFKAHKTEFDEQGIIKKLATDKSRTDRRAALEDTLDTVVRGSAEDIGKIKASLLEEGRGATPETKAAGTQAWKDIQGGVIDKLKEAATGKREIGNEQGVTQFNSSFRNLFNELDKDGKIDAVFSPEQARRLRDINKLVEDLRTTPSGRVAGSDTVPRLVSMLDKVGEIPGIGGIAKTIAGGVTKLYKAGEEGRQVRRAQSDPLQEAVKGAKSAVRGRRNKRAAAAAAPIVPASIGEQLQNEQRR
jgi:hypothetical protein